MQIQKSWVWILAVQVQRELKKMNTHAIYFSTLAVYVDTMKLSQYADLGRKGICLIWFDFKNESWIFFNNFLNWIIRPSLPLAFWGQIVWSGLENKIISDMFFSNFRFAFLIRKFPFYLFGCWTFFSLFILLFSQIKFQFNGLYFKIISFKNEKFHFLKNFYFI